MTASTQARPLPRTHRITRIERWRSWRRAAACSLVINGVLLLLLPRLGHWTDLPTLPPPPQVRAIQRLPIPPLVPPVPPVPPPPTAASTAAAVDHPAPAAAAALPALALPDLAPLPRPDSSDRSLMPLPAPATLRLALPDLVAGTTGTPAPSLLAASPRAGEQTPAMLDPAVDTTRFYPRRAAEERISGQTRVRLTMDADGAISTCQVLSSTPPGVFDQAAVALAATMHGQPARRDGVPVASVVTVTIIWDIR